MLLKKIAIFTVWACVLTFTACSSYSISGGDVSGNVQLLDSKLKWYQPWFSAMDEHGYSENMEQLSGLISSTDNNQELRDKRMADIRALYKYEAFKCFQFSMNYIKPYDFREGDLEIYMWDASGRPIPISWITFSFKQGSINVYRWLIKTPERISVETVNSPVKVVVVLFKSCTFTYYIKPNQ